MILDVIARIMPESESSPTRPSTDKKKQTNKQIIIIIIIIIIIKTVKLTLGNITAFLERNKTSFFQKCIYISQERIKGTENASPIHTLFHR